MFPANTVLSALSSFDSTRRMSEALAKAALVPGPRLAQCSESAGTPGGHLLCDSAQEVAGSTPRKKRLQGWERENFSVNNRPHARPDLSHDPGRVCKSATQTDNGSGTRQKHALLFGGGQISPISQRPVSQPFPGCHS